MELKLTMDGTDLPDDVSAEDIFLDDSQLALGVNTAKCIHWSVLVESVVLTCELV